MLKLLPSQRESLYDILTAFDFKPEDFKIVNVSHRHLGEGQAVKVKNTDFYFAMYEGTDEFTPEKFFVTFSPGAEEILESHLCFDWNLVLSTFEAYLDILGRELSVTDPWKNAKEYADKIQAVPQAGGGNGAFTEKEKKEIQNTLHDIKRLLLQQVKNDEKKQRYLTDQFTMLHDAVTKFGKKDYLMLVYTAVIGMATTIGVPPDVGMRILEMLNGLLSHVPRLIA